MNPASYRVAEKVMFFSFGLFLIASTFSIALSQTLLAVASASFLFLLTDRQTTQVFSSAKYFWRLVVFYIVLLLVACFAGGTISSSLSAIREEWLFIMVPIGALLFSDTKRREQLMQVFAVAMILLGVIAIVQFFWVLYVDPPTASEGGITYIRVKGSFSHPLTFGNYAVTGTLCLLGYALVGFNALKKRQRWLILAGALSSAIATFLSHSRTPIVALGISLIILICFLRGRRLLIALTVLMLLIAAIFTDPRMAQRFEVGERTGIERHLGMYYQGSRRFIWTNTWELIKTNPWLGVGPGNFPRDYEALIGPETLHPRHKYGHPHNDLLNVTVQSGIPTGLVFAALWLVTLGYFWLGYRRNKGDPLNRAASAAALLGSLAFLGTSVTEATFTDEEVRMLLMVVWALGFSVWYNKKRVTPENSA